MGKIYGFGFIHPKVKIVINFIGTDFGAIATGCTIGINVARGSFQLHFKITGATADRLNGCQGIGSDLTIVFNALKIDFKPTCGGTKFGEILIKLGNPASKIRVLLDEKNIIADFSSFECSGQTTYTATHNQYRTIACSVTHAKPP
jgi:hypothetical protein